MPKTPFEMMQDRMTASENRERNNTQMIMREFRRINAKLGQSESDLASMRVNPGDLHKFDGPHRGTHSSPPTDLGQPLLARLANDPTMGGSVAGRAVTNPGTGNLLLDPTFETVLDTTLTAGAAYASVGPYWQSKFSVVGTNPTQVNVDGEQMSRFSSSVYPTYSSSASADMTMLWAPGTASVVTQYLRPADVWTPLAYPQSHYLVASVRVAVRPLTGGYIKPTTAIAWVEIVNSADTVLATGDTVDLNQVYDEGSMPVVHAALHGTDQSGSVTYRMRIVVQATSSVSGSSVLSDPVFVEPSMSLSEEASPPAFQPAIGSWSPGLIGGPWTLANVVRVDVTANQDNYAPTGFHTASRLELNPTAARTITGFSAARSARGRTFLLTNINDTFNLTLSDKDAGSSADNRILGANNANVVVRPHGAVFVTRGLDSSLNERWFPVTV